jgi:S-adenosylmethionine decarboxylase
MSYAGKHLILDCILTDDSIPIVNSTQKMSEYLEEVTRITDMTLVIPPIAMAFPFSGETQRLIKRLEQEGTTSPIIEEFKQHIKHRDEDQGGVSAITVWLESHASLHSWPLDKYISIDLFSCKCFDCEPIIDFTKDFMKLDTLHITEIDRMMNAPAKIKQYNLTTVGV